MRCSFQSLLVSLSGLSIILRRPLCVVGQQQPVLINCGGNNYQDPQGNQWVADTPFANTGKKYSTSSVVNGTDKQPLYQTERWDPRDTTEMTYNISVAIGQYQVKLHFAEIWSGTMGSGLRVFDVKMEGALVFDNVDIYQAVGGKVAYIISAEVVVNDGFLTIEFLRVIENPKICAIEVKAVVSGTTPVPTPLPTRWPTPVPTPLPTPLPTPVPMTSPTPVPAPPTPLPTPWPTPVPTPLPTPLPTPVPMTSPTPVPTPPTPLPTPWPTPVPTPLPTPLPTPVLMTSPTPVPTPVPAPLPTPSLVSFPPSAPVNILINTGSSSSFVDSSGNIWEADRGFNTGMTYATSNTIIGPSSQDQPLYRTERYDTSALPQLTYNIAVPPGEYVVTLHFAEIYLGSVGARVFHVEMEGIRVLSDYDVFKEAGNAKNTAVTATKTVTVDDGNLTILFIAVKDNPKISGIEIHSLNLVPVIPWIDLNENENYTGRHECSFVQAGNKFYLFGGRENPQKLDVYDFTSNTWSLGSSAPKPFNHFQATEYEGLVWVIAAFKDNYFPNELPEEYVHVYDPANNVWMQGPRIPVGRERGGGGVEVYNGKFYLVGGNTMGHNGAYVPWMDEYDPRTGQWQRLPDAPHSRDHFHAAVVGNKLYAAGGRRTTAPDTFGNTVAEVDVFDFSSGKWVTSNLPNNLPSPRAGTATAVFNAKVIVIGGESTASTQAHKNVHALDPSTGEWSALAPLNYGRHGTQAIVSGKGIYIAAGSPLRGNGNQKKMEVYNQNIPAGIPSIAGTLSAPSSIEILVGLPTSVDIQHVTGNQGVLVNSVTLTSSDFAITSGFSVPILISQGTTLNLLVWYNGTLNGTQARLGITFSGTQTLSIVLAGRTSATASTPLPTPLPTPVPTPLPTPLTAPVPTPLLTPVPVTAPTPLPTPLPTLVPTPLPTLLTTPIPTPVAAPLPTPVPEGSPLPTPVPTPLPTSLTAPIPTPLLTPVPVTAPTPLPTPLPTLVPTPLPTPLTTPIPAPVAAPLPTPVPEGSPTLQPMSALTISNLMIVNATSELDISSVNMCNRCIDSSTQVNIRAEPFGEVGSIKLVISGPISLSRLESVKPYALFGDLGGDYFGKLLPPGNYKISVQAFSSANMGGTAGPVRMEAFSV